MCESQLCVERRERDEVRCRSKGKMRCQSGWPWVERHDNLPMGKCSTRRHTHTQRCRREQNCHMHPIFRFALLSLSRAPHLCWVCLSPGTVQIKQIRRAWGQRWKVQPEATVHDTRSVSNFWETRRQTSLFLSSWISTRRNILILVNFKALKQLWNNFAQLCCWRCRSRTGRRQNTVNSSWKINKFQTLLQRCSLLDWS